MINKHFPVKFKYFILPLVLWTGWMAGWIYAPAEELVWAPLKWIFIALFAPIGVILFGALAGYKIKMDQDKLNVGFFPFTRTIPLSKIKEITPHGENPMTVWQTEDFFTIETTSGEKITIPCDNAKEIVADLKQFIR
ncbi:MAG: hypothetical protein ABIH78_01985 [Candidatus Peregrinibacteria bacterium]